MRTFGLIGRTLRHSFSQKFFTDKFLREGIDARYCLFPMEKCDRATLHALIESHPGLEGLNVTIPYKETVIDFCDILTPEAEAIGAVNTLIIRPDGIIGANTDCRGFLQSVEGLLNNKSENNKSVEGLLNNNGEAYVNNKGEAYVLGTGGAAKAVAYALRELDLDVTYMSRNPEGHPGAIGYEALTDGRLESAAIIVNATPLGTWPDVAKAPSIPYHLLSPATLCYDLVYNPAVTEFMRRCAEQGCAVKNGLDMLHRQARLSWQYWNEAR